MMKLTLEGKLKTLKELDAEIVTLVSEDDLETEIQQADECQEKIFEALLQINRALTQPTVAMPKTARTVSLPTVDDLGKARWHEAKVKLSLPHFKW